MMKINKLAPISAGIVAFSVTLGAFFAKYQEYLIDTDLIPKIVYDISSKKTKTQDPLFSLLIHNDSGFREALEKKVEESEDSISTNLKPSLRRITRFKDKDHFISYLQGPYSFLNKSIEISYFLDAALISKKQGFEYETVNLLLRNSHIQTIETWGSREPIKDDINQLEAYLAKEWFLRFFTEIRWIQQMNRKEVLSEYGDTKAHLIKRFKRDYYELIAQYPSSLTEKEIALYKSFFK